MSEAFSKESLDLLTNEALCAGAVALSFVTQPETWPVFVAWAKVRLSGIDFTSRREEAKQFAYLLAGAGDTFSDAPENS
jgi:hypothetical protein